MQRVAFCPISSHLTDDTSRVPGVLSSRLIFAVSCADLSIRLISLSRDAESDHKDAVNKPNVKVTEIGVENGHQDLVAAISLTWTADGSYEGNSRSHNRDPSHDTATTGHPFSFLVASASTTGSGLLIVYQVPFETHLSAEADSYRIIVRYLVRQSLLGCMLSFSPSIYPSPDHLSLLLTSPVLGVVKIFDLMKSGLLSKGGQESDQATESDDALFVSRISPSITLSTNYFHAAQISCRKAILDLAWLSSGHSIMALLEDGEWGMWNIDASASASKPRNGIGRFIVLGHLNITPQSKKLSKFQSSDSLAPMTPHTRKTKSADLFGQSNQMQGVTPTHPFAKKARIALCSPQQSNMPLDDAAILTYDGRTHYVTSLQSISRLASADYMAERSSSGHVQSLPKVRLGGEENLGTHIIQNKADQKLGSLSGALGEKPDILVFTNTRIITFIKPATRVVPASTNQSLVIRSVSGSHSVTAPQPKSDELLGIEGIEKVLDSMDTAIGATSAEDRNKSSPTQLGDGVSVMESPSMRAAAARSKKLIINRKESVLRRDFFA